jgi:hypothetical protein
VGFDMAMLFCDIVKNGRKVSELKLWKKLEGRYAHAEEDGDVIPDVVVLTKADNTALDDIYKSHPLYAKVSDMVKNLDAEVYDILKKQSNSVLHAHLSYYVSMLMCDIRMMTIHDEVEAGRLIVPADAKNSNVGMYLHFE